MRFLSLGGWSAKRCLAAFLVFLDSFDEWLAARCSGSDEHARSKPSSNSGLFLGGARTGWRPDVGSLHGFEVDIYGPSATRTVLFDSSNYRLIFKSP
jgi:hypothetical protein